MLKNAIIAVGSLTKLWLVLHFVLAIVTGWIGWYWVSGLSTGLVAFWCLAYTTDRTQADLKEIIDSQQGIIRNQTEMLWQSLEHLGVKKDA